MDIIEKERNEIQEARYGVPYDMSVEKAMKLITGEAVCHTEGVLGLKGNLTDLLKKDEDLRRGIRIGSDEYRDIIHVKIIGEEGYDPVVLAARAAEDIQYSLSQGAGLESVKIEVEVAEQMTREAFLEKYGPDRSCACAVDSYRPD